MRRLTRMLIAAMSSLLIVGFAASGARAGGSSGPTVIASHLNNPRQLAFGTNGKLLVAEAGKGGPQCLPGGEEGEICLGATGSITEVSPGGGDQHRIITGLLSGAAADGTGAVGSDGVSAEHNSIFVQETFLPPGNGLPNEQIGKLLRRTSQGRLTSFADITAFESANDPDHQGFDSDPYAVLALPNRRLVTDAAGNDILSVDHAGNVKLFAVLPNVTYGDCAAQPDDNNTVGCDAVPTSLALGPNGHIFVGELSGLTPGAGQVLELDPVHGRILKTIHALNPVTGVAVASDGTIYASEFSFDPSGGKVTAIRNDGTRPSIPVPFPAGLLLGDHGKVYVSAYSIAPETGLGVPNVDTSGQVWRLHF
jgi:hypothetical protein